MPYPAPSLADVGGKFTSTIHHDSYPAIDPATNKDGGGAFRITVLITGAAKGIGRVTAIAYAKAGASRIAVSARVLQEAVAVCAECISDAKSIGLSEPHTLPLQMDVCDRRSIDTAVSTVQNMWGQLDVLVNNAAYLAPFVPMAEGDESQWWYTWEANVRGMYWVTKALLPLLLQGSGYRTVINVVSTGAPALTPGASAYQPSKFVVMRLTEYSMVDQGLLSYSVHPASVSTDLAKRIPGRIVDAVCVDKPELAGNTTVFLTRERRDWLAGRYVSYNWDMSEFLARREEIVEKDLLLKLKSLTPVGTNSDSPTKCS